MKLTVCLDRIKKLERPCSIVTNDIMENPNLSPTCKIVYYALAKMANTKTRECYPSEFTISETCGLSLSSVKRAIKQLKEAEVIVIMKKWKKNSYRLNDR